MGTIKNISAEWIWRGGMVIWFVVMTWLQSHFVTKEQFEAKTDKMSAGEEVTHTTLITMQKDMEIQSLKMTLISDHEGRIRSLEKQVEKLNVR